MSLLTLAQDEPSAPPLTPADFLMPDELREWQSFTSAKRKREWLGGRLCAYGCARQLIRSWQNSTRNWRLANAEDGCPLWQGDIPEILRETRISISHGGGYALALMARLPVGADVQPRQAKVERVAGQFAHPEEKDILARLASGENSLTRLTLLWSAKESLRKAAVGLPAFLDMRLVDGRRENDGWGLTLTWQKGAREATVAALLYDDHAFAFCLLDK